MRGITLGVLSLLLSGCNGMPSPITTAESYLGYFNVHSSSPRAYQVQGVAVQWNQDIAVTVAHIPNLNNVVYSCSSGCDLVFFRHTAEGPLPAWRNVEAGEAVTAVGSSPLSIDVKGEGVAKNTRVRLSDVSDPTPYAVHDGPIMVGMSGGPVYGKDGAVVGITIGMHTDPPPRTGELSGTKRLSIFLPYDIVHREWRLYSARQNAMSFEIMRIYR